MIFLLSAPALADIQCEAPDSLDRRIRYCSDNALAAHAARDCRQQLLKAFRDAGPELRRVFQIGHRQDLEKQKKSFHVSKEDYAAAEVKLNRLIANASMNLDRVASYPPVMLDDEDESVPCYINNAAEVELVVGDLDEKITELKEARRANVALRGITTDFNERIENEVKYRGVGQRLHGKHAQGGEGNRSGISGAPLGRSSVSAPPSKGTKGKARSRSSKRSSKVAKNSPPPGLGPDEFRYGDSEMENAIDDFLGGDSRTGAYTGAQPAAAEASESVPEVHAGGTESSAEERTIFQIVHAKHAEWAPRLENR